MAKSKYKENKLINDLIKQRENHLREIERKTYQWLKEKGYYKQNKDEKKKFLLTEKGLSLVEGLAREDLPFINIAKALSLSQKELHEFSRENNEIYDAIDMGRANKLNIVEDALYQMAQDRYVDETRERVHSSSRSGSQTKTKETYHKFIPANWYAVKYIMEQKRSMEYKAKREDDLDNNKEKVNFVINVADVGLPTIEKENKEDSDD